MTSREFDKLADEYFERFGENYPLVITSQTSLDEHAKKIRECIQSGKKAPEPKYVDGADY